MAWRPLRRGIADLHRRAQISHKAAARYLDAFATVDDTTTLDELLQRLEQPRQWRGRRVRALRPLADDRSEEHTSELQSRGHLVCRLLLEKKKKNNSTNIS